MPDLLQPIPQEWIKRYVDDLLSFAEKLDGRSSMRDACLLRAEHVMDLVRAFHQHSAPIQRLGEGDDGG